MHTTKNCYSLAVCTCVYLNVAGYNYLAMSDLAMLISQMLYYLTYVVPQIIQPPDNFHTVTFDETASSVQLICSLNIDISPGVEVTWTHNNIHVMTTPPNGVLIAGNTTTLVIGEP